MTVRSALEAQSRYSRRKHRGHGQENSTGEENRIRKWAKLLGIGPGKEVEDPSENGNMKVWCKGKREIIHDIVDAVEFA